MDAGRHERGAADDMIPTLRIPRVSRPRSPGARTGCFTVRLSGRVPAHGPTVHDLRAGLLERQSRAYGETPARQFLRKAAWRASENASRASEDAVSAKNGNSELHGRRTYASGLWPDYGSVEAMFQVIVAAILATGDRRSMRTENGRHSPTLADRSSRRASRRHPAVVGAVVPRRDAVVPCMLRCGK